MNGKPWTPADDALLRSLYAEHSAAEIAFMMGRSERAALEDALRMPDLQKSVADAIRRRLRNLGFVEMPS